MFGITLKQYLMFYFVIYFETFDVIVFSVYFKGIL